MEFFWIVVFICIIGAGISLFKKQPNSYESVAEPVPLNQENIDNLDTLIGSASSDTTKLILQQDEKLILSLEGISLHQYKITKTKGMYQGVSIRVMSGLSYRIGGFTSKPREVLSQLDVGDLHLTTERIVFLGNRESVEIHRSKLLSIEASNSFIELHQKGRGKVLFLGNLQKPWEIFAMSTNEEQVYKDNGIMKLAYLLSSITR
ncbi:MAG: hypothetical protein O3A79_05005 [Candidatus Marinimicrobia bacterium]|nr:hypothetical protein [Candidatus Neomarinimicrobiota bacterium]